MNEQDALMLASQVARDLSEIKVDVHDLKMLAIGTDGTEQQIDLMPESAETQAEPEPEPVQVVAEPTVPDGFYTDLMEVQWAQLVCMYFILAAVLVSLGVSLWRCFANMKG